MELEIYIGTHDFHSEIHNRQMLPPPHETWFVLSETFYGTILQRVTGRF